MKNFQDYAYYYNAFYQDKDYAAEARQLDTLLKKYGKNISKLINFGCGTGRHDIELTKLGYSCTGIDLSSYMIEKAKEYQKHENIEIPFQVADIRNFISKEKYDAVVSLFHVMSYQNSNLDVLSTFHSARAALEKDGLFIFDVWYGPGVLSDKPTLRVKEIEIDNYKLIRIATPVMHEKTNIVDVNYKVLIINKESKETNIVEEVHNMRYFFRPELEFYLKETGFELVDNLDCSTLGETSFDSWTSYFIARAI